MIKKILRALLEPFHNYEAWLQERDQWFCDEIIKACDEHNTDRAIMLSQLRDEFFYGRPGTIGFPCF